MLEESGGCLFHLDGFGQENRWTISDTTGQPSWRNCRAPEGDRGASRARGDAVPAGIERTLTFRPSGEQVVVHCQSWNNWWTPVPETEELSRQELLTMLDDLAADIATGLQAIGSELVERQPIKAGSELNHRVTGPSDTSSIKLWNRLQPPRRPRRAYGMPAGLPVT